MSGFLLGLFLSCSTAVERGDAALERDDLLSAEREFRIALDAAPDDPDALYGLGWTFHQAQETGPARDAFARLVKVHPALPQGYRGLGSLFASEGNLPAARVQLELALGVAPDDPAANQSLALVELGESKPADALARLERAAAAHPDRSELDHTRAVALLALGRAEDALAAAEVAVQRATSPRGLTAARITWVEAALQTSDDRIDPAACPETAPPVRAWLDAADHVLDEAEASGALRQITADMRRQVRRRRAFVEDTCQLGDGN